MIYDRKFRYACSHADKIIAISENTKKDIVQLYGTDPGKIEVIYQSCNPIFYQLRPEAENQSVIASYALPERYLLYVGSVEERKNLKLIIQAYKQAGASFGVPLVIVGKGGTYKKECQKMIAAYGLEPYFIWLDRLKDNHHLQSVYQNARALIYPSFYEGFGLPVAEAALSKIPVITARTSSLPEAGGPDAFYIDPHHTDELIDTIRLVLSGHKEVLERTEKTYRYAQEQFALKTLTDRMANCYLSV